ncbi:unnamed protein product [Pipistrellus nathusii]|uniref:Uncharacterized protein n=1 Tax=Pipistrellus nathusii TaxID=59473 RepID=A0ABN9ZL08_PIPNA
MDRKGGPVRVRPAALVHSDNTARSKFVRFHHWPWGHRGGSPPGAQSGRKRARPGRGAGSLPVCSGGAATPAGR